MSHDEPRIQSLRDDMDGMLVFASVFSAALTSFLVDKIHDLQPDPAQQMVFSQQVSAIVPQVSIHSASVIRFRSISF
ncbi:hypothetical protein EDB83DRAFT_2525521 [Lactarius deliciosus]|nr:hypothetical protein EDB83DRAFT_2525521 [Lactarius deliciosus]